MKIGLNNIIKKLKSKKKKLKRLRRNGSWIRKRNWRRRGKILRRGLRRKRIPSLRIRIMIFFIN